MLFLLYLVDIKSNKLKTSSRIASIFNASQLEESITGIPSFHLSELNLPSEIDFELPTNLRLGHLVERVVGGLLKTSNNFSVLHENTQIIQEKTTIGEIDFIVKNLQTDTVYHLELAYKFYLFDPQISSKQVNNWIGPNRKDSLVEKLEKLKTKQFPLLYDLRSKTTFPALDLEKVEQVLCLLVSLFIPYALKENLHPTFQKAIKGYYLNIEAFMFQNHSSKKYFIPTKKEWGIDPSENDIWLSFEDVKEEVEKSIEEKQSPLCWEKNSDSFTEFFITWW